MRNYRSLELMRATLAAQLNFPRFSSFRRPLPRPRFPILRHRTGIGISRYTPLCRVSGKSRDSPKRSANCKQTRAGEASDWQDNRPRVFLRSVSAQPLRLDIALFTPRDHADNVAYAAAEAKRLSAEPTSQLQMASDRYWRELWSRSAVTFEDKELERWWYHNQYWLACCLREGKVAPGLFGNWTSGKIGTAWHGDYHMNYNTQQVFWGVFSSNHVEQHLPYIQIVEDIAAHVGELRPHEIRAAGRLLSALGISSPEPGLPYPAPPWGYEICETPWVVQSLWWHYLYTQDEAVLRRVYPLLRERRGIHRGLRETRARWEISRDPDCFAGKLGMHRRLPPEPGLHHGSGADRFSDAGGGRGLAEILNQDTAERAEWARNPRAPGGLSKDEVLLRVRSGWMCPTHPPSWIYNIPVTLAPVFPGDQVGFTRGRTFSNCPTNGADHPS